MPQTSVVPTRRSARVRAGSASRKTANKLQDENNVVQRKRRGGKTTSTTEKQSTQKQVTQQKALKPLRDVTNSVRNTRSKRPKQAAAKPAVTRSLEINDDTTPAPPRRITRQSKPALRPSIPLHETRLADSLVGMTQCSTEVEEPHEDRDNDILPAAPHRTTRRCKQTSQGSVSSHEIPPVNSSVGTTRREAEVEQSCGDDDDEITPASQLRRQSLEPSMSPQEIHPAESPNETTGLNVEVGESSSDEIRPNPPKRNPRATPTPQSFGEIRPNSNTQSRRMSVFTQSIDEIRPRSSRTGRPAVPTTEQFPVRPVSPIISDSPPISPLAAKQYTETHQSSWSDENRELKRVVFDTKRPRQVIHTYGKRRRVARVSLPTMQALGVRAKSPSSGGQSSSEKQEDGDASDEYRESEDESEETPKRDPKLEAFLAEQRRLWQEVDETDLLVESD